MGQDRLVSLLGKARVPADLEKSRFSEHWQRLKRENASFRIATSQGMASAPLDYFDSSLMKRVPPGGERIARVIGDALGEFHQQVGDIMLLARVIALIESGKLVADGDPWDMHSSRIKLAD